MGGEGGLRCGGRGRGEVLVSKEGEMERGGRAREEEEEEKEEEER